MDNQETLQQNSELPKPAIDALPAPTQSAENGALQEQKTAQGGGSVPVASSAHALADVQAITGTQPAAVPVVGANHTTALTAADIDLIEKEWIAKAKEIVSKTHSDPFMQNNNNNCRYQRNNNK